LVGSVITKDMEENHIYGGSPAKDLTNKVKPQFSDISLTEKWMLFKDITIPDSIVLIDSDSHILDDGRSYFNIQNRTYTKNSTNEEYKFMKEMQSRLFKFIPKD